MDRIFRVLFLLPLFAAFIAWTFYPDIPGSPAGWVVMIILGIPAYLFMEWMGEKLLDSEFFENCSSVTRVVLGVPVFLFLIAIGWFIFTFVQQSIDTVGG